MERLYRQQDNRGHLILAEYNNGNIKTRKRHRKIYNNKPMMKNRLRIATSIALVALAALSSCSDSYPGLTYDYNGDKITNNETYDKTPVMVFVNKQNFFSVSATRGGDIGGNGVGSFDDPSGKDSVKYKNARFFIYAFRKKEYLQDKNPQLTEKPDLTYTRFSGPQSSRDTNAVNCLVDGDDFNYGMLAKLTEDKAGAFDLLYKTDDDDNPDNDYHVGSGSFEKASIYYSSLHQDVGYNFFAYYIDGLKEDTNTEPERNSESISYKITIDGTQDIMCGSAPDLRADMFGAGEDKRYDKVILTTEERDKILNYGDGGYSTFAAHRGINPIVDMKHQLAQLNFVAYPGDDGCEKITITGITVHAVAQGILTVASNVKSDIGFKPTGNETELELMEASVNGNKCEPIDKESDKYRLEWDRDELCEVVDGKEQLKDIYKNIYNRPSKKIGGSIMVPPAESYQIDLHFKQEIRHLDGNVEFKNLKSSYTIKVPNEPFNVAEDGTLKFMNGYKYDIHIAVYGLQEIQMTANIDDWKNGGDIYVDPDDPDQDSEIYENK